MKCEQLTEKQKRVIDFIKEYVQSNGVAPSQTEIAQVCNVRQGNVGKILAALEKKNYIKLKYGQARGIELVVWNDEGDK